MDSEKTLLQCIYFEHDEHKFRVPYMFTDKIGRIYRLLRTAAAF